LVGRGRERDALLSTWRAARRGEGAAVLVHGEAGLGKTRLVQELLSSLRDEGAEVLRSGFFPAGDLERPADAIAARLSGGDLEAELSRRLSIDREAAAALAAWLERRTSASGGMSPAAADGFVARLARSLSEAAPLLWVVEDLHFADADARRTVLALARAATSRRMLLCLTTRPGADPALLATLAATPGFVRVDLARLDEEGVRSLVTEALGDGTVGRLLAPSLWRRTDGIPYFVLELLRDLERSGRIVRDATGALREVKPLDDPGVDGAPVAPRALADLVRSRLASLAPDERAVLDAAAVVGFEFDPALVAAALRRPRLEVLETLGRLERRDGLVRSGARTCRFDHHLLQEVAYADLPALLRAETHSRIASAIEAREPDAQAASDRGARIASHRLRGTDPAGAFAASSEAVRYCQASARYEEGYRLGRLALAASEDRKDRERLRLLLRVSNLAETLGRPGEASALLEEALGIAAGCGGAPLVARVRLQRGSSHLRAGRYAEALEDAEVARRDASLPADPEVLFDATAVRGQALWSLGRHAEALEVHREALALSEDMPSMFAARAASDLGIVLQELGHHSEAEMHLRAAAEALEAASERRNVSTVLSNLGNAISAVGRRAEAISMYERSLASSQAHGQRPAESVAWVNLGEARAWIGDFEGAQDALRLCEEMSQEVDEPRVVTYALHRLGVVAWWSGDRAEARRRLTEALSERRRLGLRSAVGETCLVLGALSREEGRTDEAASLLREAATIAQEVGEPSVSTLARLHLAALREGDGTAARAAFEAAGPRLTADARLEGRWLLWLQDRRPEDLAAAKRLVEDLCRLAPPRCAAAMLERIPLLRAVAEASAGSSR
jgi:tetratricopeptide (TPR) repeat protein